MKRETVNLYQRNVNEKTFRDLGSGLVMGYWNNLRASGINLYERYCISCKTKKSISFFPKHQKYKKSNICFECLNEIKCTNCGEVKKYDAFKAKYSGSRKSKTECWECYISRKKLRTRKSYAKRKAEGTLPPNRDRANMQMHSLLWAKISSKIIPGDIVNTL